MMTPVVGHLFGQDASASSSSTGEQEQVETLLETDALRIERIASYGQPSPKGFWYDQPNQEWVVLLKGTATLRFSDDAEKRKRVIDLKAGDYLLIPAHLKHRVERTSPDALWLAVHAG
jgi:cupin 2 domain-containing protein